jgi:single-stranded DNA-binding protein
LVERSNKEVVDILPIEIPERVTDISSIKKGCKVSVSGQFRSFNKVDKDGEKVHLELSVFVKDISLVDDSEYVPTNTIHLLGHICKKPQFRKTPSKREISDIILAVNRIYGRSDYIPCIAWSRNARYASRFEVGQAISIDGRIQSRNYHKKHKDGTESVHTVYEVSILRPNVESDKSEDTETTEITEVTENTDSK